jgi:hypothetical protein
MLNTFQKFMLNPENKHIAWEIVRLYHPDIETKYISPYSGKEKEANIQIQGYYNGIEIKGKFNYIPQPTGIRVSVNIGVSFTPRFHGMGWELSDFEREYNENTFKAWRFRYDDSKYIEITWNEELKIFESPTNYDVNSILTKYNVPKPTPKEMLNEYYSD